ncbi:5-oxoprolinase subunit B family protein [Micromonospora yangpuensis]|uniref:Sensor histidine kinase inhibitor, KipI family n=1 Tax=Micromonospora yangpuensis TaxID=683228 RepID=A0A1C6TXM2_9ACTN|nr:allophanate hydrolase subunit 1 [Micromonospora yangpuensis]GGM01980.1 allophanate hydrolase [Micromonospora yangpuensis]SCL46429.1 sensor histidine kinase inhibitor, KipI family [Micromonospora yangpuensis]
MRIRPVGRHALLLDCADPAQVEAWRAELWRRRQGGELTAVEIVPGAQTLLLDGVPDPHRLAARLTDWTPGPAPTAEPDPTNAGTRPTTAEPDPTNAGTQPTSAGTRPTNAGTRPTSAGTRPTSAEPQPTSAGPGAGWLVEVPTEWNGPDLAAVAEHWRTGVPEVIRRLTGTEFRVAFCGFAPGFAYLTGLPAEQAVPRRATPRTRVPAGSVALAGPYAGIYPTESPGGWQLVGRTDLPLFDVHADPPARLTPGTRVRLVSA